MEKIAKKFYQVKELSILTGIPAYSIRKMARERIIPAYRINNKNFLFDFDEIIEVIKKCKV